MKRTMNISALSTPADRFVFVNHEGKRFVAEDARRDVQRDAVLAQTKMEAFPVIDDVGFELQKNSKGPENEAARKAGTLFIGNTIEELAGKMGVPADALKKTIDEYNKAVDTKVDPFGRNPNMLVNKIEKAPFYSGRIVMARHHIRSKLAMPAVSARPLWAEAPKSSVRRRRVEKVRPQGSAIR